MSSIRIQGLFDVAHVRPVLRYALFHVIWKGFRSLAALWMPHRRPSPRMSERSTSPASSSHPGLPSRPVLVFLFALIPMVGSMGMDLYLPSVHAIAREFDASATEVQQSISIYMLSMAVSMLFYGALSDTFGRRRVLLCSISGYALAALLCALAPSFTMLLASRFLQGLMAGAGLVITRAMVQDVYEGAQARRMMSLVTLFFGLGPCIAPLLGGLLQTHFGWRACFYFLTGFALFLAAFVWRALPETVAPAARTPLRLASIGGNYLRAFGNLQFCAMTVGLGLMAGANSLYITSGAEFIMNILRLDAMSFGWLFIPHIGGSMLGAAAASALATRMSASRQSRVAYIGLFIGMALNVGYNLGASAPQLPWAVLPITVYSFSVALLLPIRSIQIINFFPGMKGLASSLQSFAQIFIFALLSSVLVPLLFHSGLALAVGHAARTLLGMLIWASSLFLTKKRMAVA